MQTTQHWSRPSPLVVPPVEAMSDERLLREMGKRIAAYRRAKGWNQTELGAKVGRRQETVSKWEAGLVAMDVLDARRVSKALGITLSDLVR